jgi:hypothetical protein
MLHSLSMMRQRTPKLQEAPLPVHVLANQYLSWSGFASPAPGGAYGTVLSVFDGTNPNSTYSLYIEDLVRRDSGT